MANIAIYTFNSSIDTLPSFNYDFTYEYSDVDNGDGTITRTITSDTLPSSISFSDCTELISLSYLDTSNVIYMYSMFYGCTNLISVDLSSFNTSNATDMSGMFTGCYSLTTLDVSYLDTSNVTYMGGMFYSCKNLTSIEGLSSFNTNNAIDMSYMFYECENLTTIDVSSFNTSNVTDMYGMFQYCENLTSLDLSNFNTSKVTNMYFMFAFCTNLTSLDLSNFNTSSTTDTNFMFYECTNLTSLNLSNWNLSNVTNTSCMFDSCTNLNLITMKNSDADSINYIINVLPTKTTVDPGTLIIGTEIPVSSVDTATASSKYWNIDDSIICTIAIYTFNSSTDTLPTMTFPPSSMTISFNPGITSTANKYIFGSDLGECDIISVIIDGYDAPFSKEEFNGYVHYTVEDEMNSEMQHYDILLYDSGDCIFNANEPKNVKSVVLTLRKRLYTYTDVDNGDGTITRTITSDTLPSSISFKDKSRLVSVSYLDTNNVTDMSNMFYNCNKLTSLDVSNFNTSKVTDMQFMFYNCNKLTSLDVSNFNTSSVTNMSNMFNKCTNLTSIDVSNFNTSSVTNMQYMFRGCNKLTSLDVSNFNTSNVTDMGWMFCGCTNLTSLDLSKFDTSKVTSIRSMFYDCTNLTTLDLSNFNTSKVTLKYDMFTNCTNLNLINIKNSDINSINDIINALPTRTEYGVVDLMGNKKVSGTNYNIAKEKYWKVYYRDSDRPFIRNLSNRNTRAHSKNKNVTRH